MRAGESFYTPLSIVFLPIGACCILLVCFELVVGHFFFLLINSFFVLLPIKKKVWEIFVSRIVLPMIFVSIVLPLSFVV